MSNDIDCDQYDQRCGQSKVPQAVWERHVCASNGRNIAWDNLEYDQPFVDNGQPLECELSFWGTGTDVLPDLTQ